MAATQDKEGLAVEVSSLQLDLDNSVAMQKDFERLSQSLQVELDPAAREGGAVAARGGRGGVRRLQTGILCHEEEASLKTLRQDILLGVYQKCLFDVEKYLFNSFLRYCIVD